MKPKVKNPGNLKNKEEKDRIRASFEHALPDNHEFDAYIQSQFKKMVQEKNENPNLIIPKGFRQFLESKSFKQLLKRLYEYMECLIEFEQKFENINKVEGSKIQSDPLFKALRYETSILQSKCKEISYAYMGVLLGYGDNKMVFKDQYFFETMLYFLTQVMKQNFEGHHYLIVDEELNRIFRTDTFNLIKRRQLEDEQFKKYPALQESKYDGSAFAISKLQARLSLQKKFNYSMQIRPDKSKRIGKPLEISLSTFHSVRSRSPLIASFYPSEREKLFSFSKEVRQKQSFFKTRKNHGSFHVRLVKNQEK